MFWTARKPRHKQAMRAFLGFKPTQMTRPARPEQLRAGDLREISTDRVSEDRQASLRYVVL
jgi:hypothetical protein